MNARQRKIVLALSECWKQEGKAPSTALVARTAGFSEMTVYDEIYRLANMGMVSFRKLENAKGYECLEAELTRRAESLLPRIKELE
jgi:hypothetical protein